jgi:hypothetical protein
MKLPDYAIKIILVLAFLFAAGARFSSTSASFYPYFSGESAMNYRDALAVSTEPDPAFLDRTTNKSNWPEGYRPARVRPVGVEYFAGAVIKAATWLGDEDTRAIARRLVVLFFSLGVFTIYPLTRNLWGSQTAALMAVVMFALFPPLVEATNGKEIGHTTFALPVVMLHLLLLQRFTRGYGSSGSDNEPASDTISLSRRQWIAAAGTALTTLALLAGWELAPYYLAACSVSATVLFPLKTPHRRVLATTHLAAFAGAAILFPYASASRLAFAWPGALLAACCAQAFLSSRFPGVKRGGAFIAAATLVLTLAFTPLRAGAGGVGLPGLEYAWYRLRFLFARPFSPSLLPEQIRDLWSSDHAHPSAHALIELLLPLLFFLTAAIAEAKLLLRGRDDPGGSGPPHGRDTAARVITAAAAAGAGLAAYSVDRGALALALVAALPFVALAGRALEGRSKIRMALTIAGSLIVAGHLLSPKGGANASLQISRALDVDHRDGAKVLWLSMENTDEELLRFVATRTSTRDPFLGLPRATALLLTFSGRTSVLMEGGYRSDLSAREIEMTRLLYGNEDGLYQRCRAEGIRYILYSIEFLLDTTRYSPLYQAGLTLIPERCVALSMQFAPEELGHFNLVYQNDRHRLFRVTDRMEPVFLTDHPPVYQRDILERNGDDYKSFRERIGRLMLVYSEAKEMASVRRLDAAIARLNWCLQQAPGFTKARVALGAALLQSGQAEQAVEVLMSVIQYAPDNPDALYLAADALSKVGEKERALSLLQILYGTTRDSDLLDRARLLEALIERGATAPDSSGATPPG